MGATKDRVLEQAPFFSGQKSGLPPKTLKATDCETVQNFVLKNGTLERISGTTVYANIGGSGRVHWIQKTRNTWFAQRGTSVYSEVGEGSGTFSAVSGSVSDIALRSDLYRDELFLVNGTDMKFISTGGGTLKNIGLQAPISAAALNSTEGTDCSTPGAPAGTFSAGVYKITLTLYDPITNTESPGLNVRPDTYGLTTDLTPDSWSITFGASDSLLISQTFIDNMYANTYNSTALIDSTRATHIRVYTTGISTGVNANVFRLAKTVVKPTSGGISVTDPATGVLLPVNNIPPPNILRAREDFYNRIGIDFSPMSSVYTHCRFFRDSLFGIGPRGTQLLDAVSGVSSSSSNSQNYDSILYIHEPFQPDYVFDTREISNGDGQRTTAVAILRDSVLLIYKERSIYYLSGTSPDNYVVRVMDTRRGTVSAGTVQETPYGVFALDRAGVTLTADVGPAELVSEDIEDIIDSINFDSASTMYSGYDAKNERYYLSVPVDSANTPNKTLVYRIKEKAWSVCEGQEGASIHFGVASDYTSRFLIGGINNGTLYRFDANTAVTNNGSAFYSSYLSGPFYCGDSTRKKKAKFVYITAESATNWTIDIDIVPDFGQGQAFSLTGINSSSLYSIYAASQADSTSGVGVFDESLWSASRVRKQIKVPVSCVGFGFQVGIRTNSSNANQYGFKILSVELEAVMMGK